MKRYLVFLLIITIIFTTPSIALADSYHQGRREGQRRAEEEHSTALYWGVGLPAAFLLTPLIGGTGTIAAAYLSDPAPKPRTVQSMSKEHSEDYAIGFEEGYTDKAQSKNVRAAWGATGIAFGARLILILAADNTYASSEAEYTPAVEVGFSF